MSKLPKKHSSNKVTLYEAILIAYYFFIPFIFIPVLYDPYDFPKTFLLYVLTSLFYVLYFAVEKQLVFTSSSLLLIFFSLVAFLTSAFNFYDLGAVSLKTVFGTVKNPLSPLVFLASSLLFLATHQINIKKRLLNSFAVGLFLAGVLSLLSFVFSKETEIFNGRLFAIGNNPVYLGSALALGAAWVIGKNELNWKFKSVLFVVLSLAVVFTGTRVGLLALILATAAGIFLSEKKREKILVGFVGLLTVLSYAFLFPSRIESAYKDFVQKLSLYRAGFKGIIESPLFGHGTSSFEQFFRRLSISKYYLNFVGEVPDSTHSALLDFAFSYGVLSFLFVIALLVQLLFSVPAFAIASTVVFKFSPANTYTWLIFIACSAFSLKNQKAVMRLNLKPLIRAFAIALSIIAFVLSVFSGYREFLFHYHMQKAVELAKTDLKAAIENLDKAQEFNQREVLTYLEKARLLLSFASLHSPQNQKNLLQEVSLQVDKAIEVDPYNFETHILKADILSALGNREALDAANAALYLSPYDAVSYYYRGLAKASLSDFKGAEKDWLRAVSLKPDYVEAYFSLGYLYETKRDFKKAEYYYQTALKYAGSQEAETIKEALNRIKR